WSPSDPNSATRLRWVRARPDEEVSATCACKPPVAQPPPLPQTVNPYALASLFAFANGSLLLLVVRTSGSFLALSRVARDVLLLLLLPHPAATTTSASVAASIIPRVSVLRIGTS